MANLNESIETNEELIEVVENDYDVFSDDVFADPEEIGDESGGINPAILLLVVGAAAGAGVAAYKLSKKIKGKIGALIAKRNEKQESVISLEEIIKCWTPRDAEEVALVNQLIMDKSEEFTKQTTTE